MKALILAVCLALLVPPAIGSDSPADDVPPIPNFTLVKLGGGQRVEMDSFRGRPVIVTFWASWCGPCRQELPELERLGREFGEELSLVAVSLDDMEPAAHRFITALGLEIPVYRVDRTVPMRLGIRGLPTTILLDREGVAARIFEGYIPTQIEDIRRRVLTMLEQSDERESEDGGS